MLRAPTGGIIWVQMAGVLMKESLEGDVWALQLALVNLYGGWLCSRTQSLQQWTPDIAQDSS